MNPDLTALLARADEHMIKFPLHDLMAAMISALRCALAASPLDSLGTIVREHDEQFDIQVKMPFGLAIMMVRADGTVLDACVAMANEVKRKEEPNAQDVERVAAVILVELNRNGWNTEEVCKVFTMARAVIAALRAGGR